jgi:hypothetical protein
VPGPLVQWLRGGLQTPLFVSENWDWYEEQINYLEATKGVEDVTEVTEEAEEDMTI